MKRLALLLLISAACFSASAQVNFQKKSSQASKKKRQKSEANKNFGSSRGGSVYINGTKVLHAEGMWFNDRQLFHAGFEYYLNEKIFIGGSTGFKRDTYFSAVRNVIPLYGYGGYNILNINGTIYVNAILGATTARQSINFIETPVLKPTMLFGVTGGGEVVMNVLPGIAAYIRLRQSYIVNDDQQHFYYSLGIKKNL
jgi:hypothetical protein